MNKSLPLSSKFRINASGHLIPLLTKKWRVKLSSESVRHVQLLFLWDGRVASDTLNVFVSWQLHNINWQQVVVSRFYIIYCQSKTVHRRFSLPRVAFCVDFVGLYWTFLVVRHGKSFRCNGSYIPWIVSWTSFGFSFIEFEVLLPCGSFDKVLRLPLNTFPCAPRSLVTQNGLYCWTIPCLKALLPWNFPRDLFQTELEYLPHKAAEALGLLPMPFSFRPLCFDWSAFRVCSNWTSFIRQSP